MANRYGETTHKVYRFICDFKTANDGNSPTVREISDACQLKSNNTASYHLRELVITGKIVFDPQRARSIRVVGGRWVAPGKGKIRVPLAGTVMSL